MYKLFAAPQPQPGTQLVQRVNGSGLGDYLSFSAHQPGPGTELIQRVDGTGFGAYCGTPTYFATPAGAAGIRGLAGLGCGCGGKCGGCRASDNTFGDGMGYFDTGLDYTGWGWQEWATVGFGFYVALSVVSTTSRGVRGAREGVSRARRAVGRKVSGSGPRKKRKKDY